MYEDEDEFEWDRLANEEEDFYEEHYYEPYELDEWQDFDPDC